MPGCPNGADPQPGLAGVQHLLQVTGLDTVLADVINRYAPTALAAYTASMVDISELCALNPDPPAPLTMLDFVRNLTYLGSPLASQNVITQYIFKWLQYQEFTRVCVCRAPVFPPDSNCLHPTNITIPSGQNNVIPLGAIDIPADIYDSWPVDSSGNLEFGYAISATATSGAANALNWFVQFQGTDGAWADMIRGDGYVNGDNTTHFFTIQNGLVRLPRHAALRIRTDFGATGQLAVLNHCFEPFPAAMQPIPPQDPLPGGPTVPHPTCSTDDLCAIVLELGRQLTRVSAQVADIQATVGGTDTLTVLASQPISGEGEATLVVGTRAVSIELTHLGPGVFTSALGRPRGLMRAGSIRWGDGEGYSKRQFVDAQDFTRLRPQGALTVSWQLINECSGALHFLG